MANKALQNASDAICRPGLAFVNLEKPAEKTSVDSSPPAAVHSRHRMSSNTPVLTMSWPRQLCLLACMHVKGYSEQTLYSSFAVASGSLGVARVVALQIHCNQWHPNPDLAMHTCSECDFSSFVNDSLRAVGIATCITYGMCHMEHDNWALHYVNDHHLTIEGESHCHSLSFCR